MEPGELVTLSEESTQVLNAAASAFAEAMAAATKDLEIKPPGNRDYLTGTMGLQCLLAAACNGDPDHDTPVVMGFAHALGDLLGQMPNAVARFQAMELLVQHMKAGVRIGAERAMHQTAGSA